MIPIERSSQLTPKSTPLGVGRTLVNGSKSVLKPDWSMLLSNRPIGFEEGFSQLFLEKIAFLMIPIERSSQLTLESIPLGVGRTLVKPIDPIPPCFFKLTFDLLTLTQTFFFHMTLLTVERIEKMFF